MSNLRNTSGTPQSVTTDPTTGEPTLKPTAKVLAGAITSCLLVVVVAMLAAITPELLDFFGPWAPVIFAGVVALGGFLASYIKRP